MSIPVAQYRLSQRRRKYGNVPVEIDGMRFDSKAEGRHYALLKQREKAGEIGNLRRQERYVLKGANGEVICVYVADFVFYDHAEKRERVIDVKGGKATQTPLFRIKQKLMRANLGIEVEVVQ